MGSELEPIFPPAVYECHYDARKVSEDWIMRMMSGS